MKTEIVNFVKDLPQEVFSYNLSLNEGLYIFVDLDEEGKLISFEKGVYKKPKPETAEKKEKPKKSKKNEPSIVPPENSEEEIQEEETEMNPFFKRCLVRLTNSSMLTANKRYNQSFEIGSPFGIGFKKDVLLESTDEKTGKTKGYPKNEILKKIDGYFEVANTFIDPNNETQKNLVNAFKIFCKKRSVLYLNKIFKETKTKAIYIFLSQPTEDDFELAYQKYLAERGVFNDPKSAIEFNSKKYQVSDTLNGFGIKKMFLEHKTAPFELNMLIDSSDAVDIWKFFELVGRRDEDGNKVLPNPCPIFIDKKELNGKVISILKENGKIGYSEIIKKLFENPDTKSDLGNYYLLFFQFVSQKGFRVFDLDFVPSFQYEIKDMQIEEIFPLGGKVAKKINNVFEFEREISNKIFNGQLVSVTKAGGLWLKYFGDIEYNLTYLSDNTYNQVLKYRRAFYDYVYKSKRESIQDFMFHDIMLKGILDDLRADEYKNKKHSKWYPIREKLNIWFSLYKYFNYNLKQEKSMASRIKEHLEMMQKLVKGEQQLQNDDEFAFATGQVIAYLYSKSESADRSYSRLEPFLQKTECIKLQEAIKNAFNTYKHKTYSNNFKKPFADVMDYRTDRNLQELMPTILAGFFANNALFADKENEEENTVENNT